MLNFATWSTLQRAANAIFPKASVGLVLVYVVFYLKRKGFDTAPLEVTLAGCLLLLTSVAVIYSLTPRLVSRHVDEYQYESYIQHQVTNAYVTPLNFIAQISNRLPTKEEATTLGYVFDDTFGYSLKDLQASLGEFGVVTFVARLLFLRQDNSLFAFRVILLILGGVGLLLMYWRPLSMLAEIYLKTNYGA